MYATQQTIAFIAGLATMAHAMPASNIHAGMSLRVRDGQAWPFAAYVGSECKGDVVQANSDNGEQLWDNGGGCHTYSNVGSVAVGKLASNCRLYKYPQAQCGGKESRVEIILAQKDQDYVSNAPNTICMGESNYTSLGYECDAEDSSSSSSTTSSTTTSAATTTTSPATTTTSPATTTTAT